MSAEWMRHRFRANVDDPRPILWPPPGPFWITGESDTHATVVAYLPKGMSPSDLTLWPEAEDVDSTPAPNGPEFSGRFPRRWRSATGGGCVAR